MRRRLFCKFSDKDIRPKPAITHIEHAGSECQFLTRLLCVFASIMMFTFLRICFLELITPSTIHTLWYYTRVRAGSPPLPSLLHDPVPRWRTHRHGYWHSEYVPQCIRLEPPEVDMNNEKHWIVHTSHMYVRLIVYLYIVTNTWWILWAHSE